jgi:tRNA nucleotidyltransferase/poly(A) polymerase
MRQSPDQFMASLDLPEVYRVGGSVRDELLGRESKDSDYMVRGAALQEIKAALDRADTTKVKPLKLRDGRQVGWRAHVRGIGLLEIVLPRTERSTGPGHTDFEIIASPDLPLEQDAERRDFTINSLYRDVYSGEVIDPLNMGRDDIEDRIIDTTHPDSFRDDPLRTLRALRFVSKLDGFALSGACHAQMERHADAVTGLTRKGVSGTALTEFGGMLMGRRPGLALRIARDTGVLTTLFPELEPMIGFEQRTVYHTKTTDEHTFDAVQAAASAHVHAPLRVRWALLFHDSGKPDVAWTGDDGREHYYALSPERAVKLGAGPGSLEDHEMAGARRARKALKRLNAGSALIHDVDVLIKRHMLPLHENVKPFKVRKWRAELGDELLRDLIAHRLFDVIGKGGDISEAVEVLAWMEQERSRAASMGVPTNRKELAITGGQLHDTLGLTGRAIGWVQDRLLHEVLAQPNLNTPEWLLQRANKLAREAPEC